MGTQSVHAIVHTPDQSVITKKATCTTSGEKVVNCKNCGLELERSVIAATGHRKNNGKITLQATCTQEGESNIVVFIAMVL